MNITVERFRDCKAAIRVEVPSEKVESERASVTSKYHRQASIPGFRPGKAPIAMITRRYGKVIEEDLRQKLIASGYQEGKSHDGLDVISVVDVKDDQLNPDGSFSFTVEVITVPAFELPPLEGIPVRIPKASVTEELVGKAIEDMRERHAEYPEVEGRPLELGDVAVIDYHGFIDGRPIREVAPVASESLQEGAEYWLKMSEAGFLPGFVEGLVGMSAGETRQVPVTLPENFPVEGIAGKTVTYEVTLRNVHTQVLPEVNDEFAVATELADNAASLPDEVRKRLEQELAARIDNMKREQVVARLTEAVQFDIPQPLLEQATKRRVQELVNANQERGVPEEAIIESQDEILAAASQQAQFDVKTNFLLHKVAAKEGLHATNEELHREVMLFAYRVRADKTQMRRFLKNGALLDRLRENLVARKAIDFLLASAAIEEVDPSQLAEAPQA